MHLNIRWDVKGLNFRPEFVVEADTFDGLRSEIFKETKLLPLEQYILPEVTEETFDRLTNGFILMVSKRSVGDTQFKLLETVHRRIQLLENRVAKLERAKKRFI